MRRISCYAISIFMLLFSTPALAIDLNQSHGEVLSYVGSFTQSVPIAVAPGRAGMQPALALQYSSSLGNGLYGFGWNLDIARIERDNKNSVPKYDASDRYVLIMKGARQALISVGGNEYRVANENAFLKITRTAFGWEIRDQNNTVFSLDAAWPMSGIKQFSWSLSHVADVNGNSMDYYYADGGAGHRLTSVTYGVDNRVEFAYESRPDSIMSYRSGMRSEIHLRLSAVRSYAGASLASHIGLAYQAPLPHDKRSLLSNATVYDVDGLLPSRATQFDYMLHNQSVADGAWDTQPNWRSQTYNNAWEKAIRVEMDVNGDGKIENATGKLWRNDKNEFSAPFIVSDEGVDHYSYFYSGRTYTKQRLADVPFERRYNLKTYYRERAIVDMNGDGYLDWVVHDAAGDWRIYFHNGTNPDSNGEAWANPSGKPDGHALYDYNGDGLPDLLYLDSPHYIHNAATWTVYLNTGTGFDPLGFSVHLSQWPIFDYSAWVRPLFQPAGMMDSTVPAILAHQPWNAKPLMTTVTEQASGLVKTVEYALQSNIANAPKMKLWVASRITTNAQNVEQRSSVYSYSNGLYVISKQEFRGFGTVTQTDEQTGAMTTTTYAHGDAPQRLLQA